MAVTVLLVVVLVGLGAGALAVRAVAQRPANAEPSERRARPTNTEELTTVAGFVVQASPDGKSFTLEFPAEVRGEDARAHFRQV
jgi:hypothetical protein